MPKGAGRPSSLGSVNTDFVTESHRRGVSARRQVVHQYMWDNGAKSNVHLDGNWDCGECLMPELSAQTL
eukprot:3908243-Amphidinium_carterae.1